MNGSTRIGSRQLHQTCPSTVKATSLSLQECKFVAVQNTDPGCSNCANAGLRVVCGLQRHHHRHRFNDPMPGIRTTKYFLVVESSRLRRRTPWPNPDVCKAGRTGTAQGATHRGASRIPAPRERHTGQEQEAKVPGSAEKPSALNCCPAKRPCATPCRASVVGSLAKEPRHAGHFDSALAQRRGVTRFDASRTETHRQATLDACQLRR